MTITEFANPADAPRAVVKHPGLLWDEHLGLLSDSLDDIERTRIATANRHQALTRNTADRDGLIRGRGLRSSQTVVVRAQQVLDDLMALEDRAAKTLTQALKYGNTAPLALWAKNQPGVGEKQLARLLASIGDPYWHDRDDRPRTVSELWAYSGYAVRSGEAQRRKKGEKSNWSTQAKTRAYLIAESCVKQKGREGAVLRAKYDQGREKYAEAVHSAPCPRCGPAGHPAAAGSPLSDGHKHARALRLVAKELLRLLWLEAKAEHERAGEVEPETP